MGAIETLRDALFGNPPSQTTEPSREGVLKAFEETVQSINSVVGGIFTEDASAVYATRATLFSNLGFPDRTLGVVYADPNSDYLGIYVKSGVSGSGGWNFTGLLGRGPGPTDEQIYLAYEEYVDQISADVVTAQTAASAALAAAGVGKYDDTADGLADTSLGQTFWVDLGNGLGQVYRHDAGPVATALQKFIIDPSGDGASALIGTDDGDTLQEKLDRLPLDPRTFGAAMDGVTDDGPALKLCFAALAATGGSILIPSGKTLLFTDQTTLDTGIEIVPPANVRIFGEGKASVLKYKRVAYSSSYGLSIQNDNFELFNLSVHVDINGGTGFAAPVAIVGDMKNFIATDVWFDGLILPVLGDPSGQYAILNWFADWQNMRLTRCNFRYLDFGFVKTTGDFSTQSGFFATDCTAEFCQEVFEFNSPGLFNATATSGSAVLTGVDTGTTYMTTGRAIKSPALPAGTTIVSIDSSSQITVSANATASGSKRFSIGTMRDINIERLTGKNILQWGVGVANCRDIRIHCHFEDVAYEAVHLEDHSENISVSVSGARCNTEDGVPGSSGSNNGAVQILSGCARVSVEFRDFDTSQNVGGTFNGLCVQGAGGNIAGTTGESAANSEIAVSGRVLLQDGGSAVVAFETDIDYRDLKAVSLDPASKADPVFKMNSASWSGRVHVLNPATLLETNDTAMGQWSEVHLTTGEVGFPDLVWASGFFAADRNAPPILSKATFLLTTTADPSYTWRTLCRAPQTLLGKVFRKYVGGQHAYEAGDFKIVSGAIVPTDVFVETNSIDLTPLSGSPKQTDDGWRIDSGNLQFRALADPAIDCSVRITLTGDMVPAA